MPLEYSQLLNSCYKRKSKNNIKENFNNLNSQQILKLLLMKDFYRRYYDQCGIMLNTSQQYVLQTIVRHQEKARIELQDYQPNQVTNRFAQEL